MNAFVLLKYRLFIYISLFFLFFACQPAKTVVLFIDNYSGELWGSEIKEVIQKIAAKAGYNFLEVLNKPGDNYLANLKKALHNDVDKAIVSPLLAYEVNQLASQFPQKQFLILLAPEFQEKLASNVIFAREDRIELFFELGKKTALLLDSQELSVLGNKVGIIYFGEANLVLRQIAEFERGFSTGLETDNLLKKELANLTDKANALRAVEDLFQQGVRLWLLKAYQLNSTCMEKINSLGGYFIVEDFSHYKAFEDRLFWSIETDYESVVENFLRLQKGKYTSVLDIQAKIVPGQILASEKIKKILE